MYRRARLFGGRAQAPVLSIPPAKLTMLLSRGGDPSNGFRKHQSTGGVSEEQRPKGTSGGVCTFRNRAGSWHGKESLGNPKDKLR